MNPHTQSPQLRDTAATEPGQDTLHLLRIQKESCETRASRFSCALEGIDQGVWRGESGQGSKGSDRQKPLGKRLPHEVKAFGPIGAGERVGRREERFGGEPAQVIAPPELEVSVVAPIFSRIRTVSSCSFPVTAAADICLGLRRSEATGWRCMQKGLPGRAQQKS